MPVLSRIPTHSPPFAFSTRNPAAASNPYDIGVYDRLLSLDPDGVTR
jgi:hypothetical protein